MANRPFRVRDLMVNVVPDQLQPQVDVGNVLTPRLCANFFTPQPCFNIFTRACFFWNSCNNIFTPPCHVFHTFPVAVCTVPSNLITDSIACTIDPTEQFTPTINQTGTPEVQQQNLAALKAQLQHSLQQVEAQERLLNEQMRPQSEAEADTLMERMEAAMTELRSLKDEMRKRSTGGG